MVAALTTAIGLTGLHAVMLSYFLALGTANTVRVEPVNQPLQTCVVIGEIISQIPYGISHGDRG